MAYYNTTDKDIETLREYNANPKKWDDWRELSPKLRFLLQRMLFFKGQTKIVIEIAKDASHRLGHCHWCTHDSREFVDKVVAQMQTIEEPPLPINENP